MGRYLNQELCDEIKKQLSPIFLKLYKTSPSYKKLGESNIKLADRINRNSSIRAELSELQKVILEKSISSKYSGLMDAFSYILRIEVIATYFIDLTLLLLVGEGACIHLNPDNKHNYVRHATSLQDIESPSLSLYVKLDFLETHDIKIFKKNIDRNLRNSIAHGFFFVDDNGNFYIIDSKGKKIKKDLKQKIKQLDEFLNAMLIVFSDEICKVSGLPERPRD